MNKGNNSNSSKTCNRVYLQFQWLSKESEFSDSLRCFATSMIVLIALLSSFSLKKVLISEKMFVLSGLGIGLSIFWFAL
jgi:hypothetical protein